MLRFRLFVVNAVLLLLLAANAAAQDATPTPQMSSTAWVPTLTPFDPTDTPAPPPTPTNTRRPTATPTITIKPLPQHYVWLPVVLR